MATTSHDIEELSLEQKVGQLLHIGIGLGYLETDEGWPVEDVESIIDDIQPGAIRVYGRHGATPHFMAQYINQLQRWSKNTAHGSPLIVSADSEYGIIDLVTHETTAYPALMGRTEAGDWELAKDVSRAVARDMRSIGLTMSHQPVVDVNTNPDNPVIGVRSPGSDPETVSEYAGACLEGTHAEDQLAVAKHFPGHGDTELDSHHELPHVTYDRETLESIHLPPFEAMIEQGVDCIMTSHIVVECLDPDNPATLSRTILTDLLREELGFDGIIITDAMMMDAIADNYGDGEAAVRAIDAGADLILTGFVSAETLSETRDAIVEAVKSGDLTESRIDESVERVLSVKDDYELATDDNRYVDPLEALETTGSVDQETLARNAYERSFSVQGNDDLVPMANEQTVLLTGIRGVHAMEPYFSEAFDDVVSYSLAPSGARTLVDSKPASEPEALETNLETLRSIVGGVDSAVVTTYAREAFSADQRRVVETLADELPVVVASLGLPNEYDELPDDVAYVPTYAQDRLGMPEPFPEVASEALVETLTSGE